MSASSHQQDHVVIIGAGIGGLSAAALLAAKGCRVTVVEKAEHAGGKARRFDIGGAEVDAGPTVFTLRDVFENIFSECGARLTDHVTVRPAETLARHAWSMDERLDLFADPDRSEEAIGDFAGAKAAKGFRSMRAEAKRIYDILDAPLLRQGKVTWPPQFIQRIGLGRMGELSAVRPYESMWKVLGEHFEDQRLRQLYGRYATYCGSSPFDAPATLMLIGHVEAQGVWLIDGGMSALAKGLQSIGEANGAHYRFGNAVTSIETESGQASGVILDSGEHIAADRVIVNADPAALANGRFGKNAQRATRTHMRRNRSFSAMVWLANAQTSGFPLKRHNVFFSPDYAQEFTDIWAGMPPKDPTVYVCAMDREKREDVSGRERFQVIVNAPANGDTHVYSSKEREECTRAMSRTLARCGMELETDFPHQLLTPNEFESFLPSTGGAIYGRASHGWAASFLRQGTKTRIPGLYCAGGSTHPGAGVPMAALSGQLAARTVMTDLASTRRSHPAAMPGGMSMPSATTGNTG
ncbi:1-hydroxycarotenoid 3,4-desaturase CrtD [Aurantiacibacter sediminis]|uniref:Phytoene desaturase n=1 Tax=Aurantiacibacter sediminis TaxID=2793064 RepID=A0ABS0N201_9SPHN|nr:1-hydroxycarotenoid 3,4-desaturase CrtD [Aurantiacibacter sediminis]MBH5321990.1 phytoene desaturase [Aurantiacibacter sediminis]